jgi:hypothetical protein
MNHLPWNQEPLCGPPFPKVAPDRRGRSYRFSFGEDMRRRARRVRVKRYVVTDYVIRTIPVRREELRLEEELVDESGARD